MLELHYPMIQFLRNRLYYRFVYSFFTSYLLFIILFIRDGPLKKVMGAGGEFSAGTNFFFRSLLVQEFFFQVNPSARIFFLSNIAFFEQ